MIIQRLTTRDPLNNSQTFRQRIKCQWQWSLKSGTQKSALKDLLFSRRAECSSFLPLQPGVCLFSIPVYVFHVSFSRLLRMEPSYHRRFLDRLSRVKITTMRNFARILFTLDEKWTSLITIPREKLSHSFSLHAILFHRNEILQEIHVS